MENITLVSHFDFRSLTFSPKAFSNLGNTFAYQNLRILHSDINFHVQKKTMDVKKVLENDWWHSVV